MIILSNLYSGFLIGLISEKAVLTWSDKPVFIEALIARIFRNPSIVKCSFNDIKSNACLNSL